MGHHSDDFESIPEVREARRGFDDESEGEERGFDKPFDKTGEDSSSELEGDDLAAFLSLERRKVKASLVAEGLEALLGDHRIAIHAKKLKVPLSRKVLRQYLCQYHPEAVVRGSKVAQLILRASEDPHERARYEEQMRNERNAMED